MSVQSVALASLTATYTDSEGDDGFDDERPHHHHGDSTSNSTVKLDDRQNSDVRRSRHRRTAESPFGRSTTNSDDDDDVDRDEDGRRDRDDDDDDVDVDVRRNDNSTGNEKTNMGIRSRNAPTLVTDVTSKVQRLVSYFDDTVVSDDEMGTGAAFGETRQSNNLGNVRAITRKRKKNNNNAAFRSPKRRGELVSDCGEARHDNDDGDDDDDDEEEEEDATEAEAEEEDIWGVTIPPEPAGQCPVELQDKIANLYRKMESGLDMNLHIQQRKEFRNPSIYEKLIQFCSINEMGTNYPPDRFDPLKWGKDSYYEELARVQKNEMDKLEKARKEKTKIEIVTGTAKRPSANPSIAEDDAKRRKSKWDQVATGASTAVKSSLVMSQPTLTTLTSSATGTKATVISAFGSLPKKRL